MDHRIVVGFARVLVVLGMAAGALAVGAAPAAAHASLVDTTPANGSHLAQAPREVLLRFTEPVSPVRDGFSVLDGAGRTIAAPKGDAAPGDGAQIRVPLPSLGDGGYVVNWRVLSGDSHPVNGALAFSVGSATVAPNVNGGAQAGADRLVELLMWLFRLASYASLALLIGGGFFVAACWPAGRTHEPLRRLLATAWTAAMISAVCLLILQGPNVTGRPLGAVFDVSLLADTVTTSFGLLVLVRLGLLAGTGVLLTRLTAVTTRQATLVAGLGGALALTWAASGHAATGMLSPLAIILDAAHLAAMSAWLGGLAVLVVYTLDRRRRIPQDEATLAVSRFSRTATIAVVVLAGTGLLQAGRMLLEFGTGSQYTTLLVFKIAVFGLVLWLGSLSRVLVQRRLLAPSDGGRKAARRERHEVLTQLRRSVGWEVGIAAVVLGLTAALVDTPPDNQSQPAANVADLPTAPFLGTVPLTGGGDVQISMDPARTGTNHLVLNIRDQNAANRDVPEITAELQLEGGGTEALPVPLTRTTVGQFTAHSLLIPIPGTWQLRMRVRTSDLDQTTVETQIPVR